MIWAQWAIGTVAVIGAVVFVILAFALWRRIKAFFAMLARSSATLAEASATLADASAALETVQAAGSARFGSTADRAAYTRSNPTN